MVFHVKAGEETRRSCVIFFPLSASVPVSTDDAWGTPAQPSDLSPSDPFGDGKSKANDPWGAGSSASGNSEGKLLFEYTFL